MTVEHQANHLVRIEPDMLPERAEQAVLHGAAWAPADVRVIGMRGPAAADCLQGLLTNDIVAPGPDGFVYGALLTTKGMIVCDIWVARDGNEAWVFAPPQGLDAALDVFKRFVPPRLARHEVASDQTVMQIVGPRAVERAAEAGIAVPRSGAASRGTLDGVAYRVARPRVRHAFELQLWCARSDLDMIAGDLEKANIVPAPATALELARILAGVPRLGTETDEKTLPQEVRFEELDGVSFSKGCYTGQETVARLHFRGHANRWLAGLTWNDTPDATDQSVVRDGKVVGRVTSVAWLRETTTWIGLGILRREVEPGDTVQAAGQTTWARSLPHHLGA